MSIPDFQSIFLPLLKYASDGQEHSFKAAREKLAEEFSLTAEEIKQLLPSGQQALFANRVGWSKSSLLARNLESATLHL